jgi:molybdopterin synthase sulfur carrier subunit
MKVKFFAYIRDYTGCKEGDYPYAPNLRALLASLGEKYGAQFRAKTLSKDGLGLSPEIIILVNGRHVQHLQGIDTPLTETDVVQIFPLVAGG